MARMEMDYYKDKLGNERYVVSSLDRILQNHHLGRMHNSFAQEEMSNTQCIFRLFVSQNKLFTRHKKSLSSHLKQTDLIGLSSLLSTGIDLTGSSRVSSCPSAGAGFFPSSNSHSYM